MKIGLVPMSAKPYHLGHHMLVQLAALGDASDAAVEGAPENDEVFVLVSYTSRGTKPGTKKSGGKERPIPGETPIFGEDMKYIWETLLIPNLEFPSNVTVLTPADGILPSPITSVHKVLESLHRAREADDDSVTLPYIGVTVDPSETVITVYSDIDDIDQNYPDSLMNKLYPGSFGTGIMKFGIPRSSTVEISGTKMRKMLCNGDKAGFLPMLPPLPSDVAEEVFNTLSTSAIRSCPRSDWSSVSEGLIRNLVRFML